jgi:hypothetical protein
LKTPIERRNSNRVVGSEKIFNLFVNREKIERIVDFDQDIILPDWIFKIKSRGKKAFVDLMPGRLNRGLTLLAK